METVPTRGNHCRIVQRQLACRETPPQKPLVLRLNTTMYHDPDAGCTTKRTPMSRSVAAGSAAKRDAVGIVVDLGNPDVGANDLRSFLRFAPPPKKMTKRRLACTATTNVTRSSSGGRAFRMQRKKEKMRRFKRRVIRHPPMLPHSDHIEIRQAARAWWLHALGPIDIQVFRRG